MSSVCYRFTIFERDGVTPWFGTYAAGEVTVADFQTPDATLTHARPYLLVPEGFSPSEVDFLNGSSRIGAGSVAVMDKRITAADQTTGLVTSRIKDAPGSRVLLERWNPGDAAWRRVLDGVCSSYSVDPDDLLIYLFHLRDAREFEREQPLFFSNFVLFGEGGMSGPGAAYGDLPVVAPWESVSVGGAGGIDHFVRLSDVTPADGIHWGKTPLAAGAITADGNPRLTTSLTPTQDQDGVFRYHDFRVEWRAQGSSDPWVTLRATPRAEYAPAVEIAHLGGTGPIGGGSVTFFGVTTLYFGSEDSAEIPTDGQEIEFRVYAERITPDSPFFWDNGTLGDLLEEIVAGDHTEEPPLERYDTAALAAFALSSRPARFVLRAPVPDRRRWVEENIYKASFTAPAFNLNQELRPVAWRVPTTAELAGAPVIDAVTIQPIGEWEHGTDNAIGEIEFTYLRESVVEPEDDDDERSIWERLTEEEVTVTTVDPDAAPGAGTLVYAPVTIRSTGISAGKPNGPDTQDEFGRLITEEAAAVVFSRFRDGAAKYAVDVIATTGNLNLFVGQFVLVRFPPLPEYATGRRGLARWMQIYAIADVAPHLRRLSLVDSGVSDFAADPDVVDPTYTGCLTQTHPGGSLPAVLPSGHQAYVYLEDGELVNGCGSAITLPGVLLVAGGGAGGPVAVGGGGGAGGALIAEDVLIGAGVTAPITIGAGGAAGSAGEDTVLWLDRVTGLALDPLTDDPDDGYRAVGGGEGGSSGSAGGAGGSGGGAGRTLPITGGGTQTGGAGTAGQGGVGGQGVNGGGTSTCQGAGAGGGGSYAGAGEAGTTGDGQVLNPASEGGAGGAGMLLDAWGVQLGGGGQGGAQDEPQGGTCQTNVLPGAPGAAGYGAGGGGAAAGAGATPGTDGMAVIAYRGAAAPVLDPPVISTTDTTDQNQVEVCIDAADWPLVTPADYVVAIYYAVGAVEPDAASGDWLLAGTLEAPGCVITPPVPTGATVWTRASASATNFPPSDDSTPTDLPTPETPGLLALSLTLDADGFPVVAFTPNQWAGYARVRGLVHELGDSTDRPLALLTDLDTSVDTEYTHDEAVPPNEYGTVDVEAWASATFTGGTAPVLLDSFTRADSDTVGGTWVERGTGPLFEIVSNTLRMTGGAGTPLSVAENTAGSMGKMFLQSKVQITVTGDAQSQIVARFDWNAAAPHGYILAPTNVGWSLRKWDAGTETQIDSATDTKSTGSFYDAQLYVADGIQEAYGNGQTLNATDATHDGDNARTAAAKFHRNSGTPTNLWDDFFWFTDKVFTVTNLPTGWKAKLLNGAAAVVATATEASGTAAIDCSRYGGCTEQVPAAGWPVLIATDAADVEQARLDTVALYPGMSSAYSPGIGFGELTGPGRVYRASIQNVPKTIVTVPDPTTVVANDLLQFDGMKWANVTPTVVAASLASVFAANAIAWSAVNKAGSSIADLADWPADDAGVLTNDGAGALTWEAAGAPGAHTHPLADLEDFGAAGGYVRSNGSAWVRVSGLAAADLTGTLAYAQLPTGGGTWALGGDLGMTGGALVIGHTATVAIAGVTPRFQVLGTDGSTSQQAFVRFAASGASPALRFGKSRGATIGTYTVLQSGDGIGVITFGGADGTDLDTFAAFIQVKVSGTPAANRMPGAMEFWTAAGAGDNDVTLRWTLTPLGVWEANGAQTIQTSTGALTLATAAGNGDVIVSPHGTGLIDALKLLRTLASATGGAGFRLPHGAAPSAPVDGDLWTTTAGLYIRVNGATVGPLS